MASPEHQRLVAALAVVGRVLTPTTANSESLGTSWNIASRKKFFDFRNKAVFSVNFVCHVGAYLCNKPIFDFKTITVIVSK